YLSGRATTISRSLQIVGNITMKPVNENFTLCEGNNYVDCETDTTGADLLVQDDIEAIGSIFSQENITADDTGFFSFLGSLTNRITKLWVQDIDVSGNLIGITKEVFFPIDATDANFGDFRTKSLSSGNALRTNFQVPSDFSTLVSLEIILVPTGTNVVAPVDLYSDYGTIEEVYNQHSESLSTTWNLDTADNFYAMNISGVFTNLNAGDFCGIQIDEGVFGFTTHYLGIKLRYKT
ncbi:MAG: hypothetical protein KKB31_00185, partial [Nanoarchaeota archaeon]|nr:hypothetical protein [Nanoarchaeota archaeon]